MVTPAPAQTTVASELAQTLAEVKSVVVGPERLVERLLVALLADGHCLGRGVSGLAKSLAAQSSTSAVGGVFALIEFTPDLVLSDINGSLIYRATTETFDVELGPVMANLVLADEI